MELRKITEADLEGRGVVGMADTPNLSAIEMQKKVEEVVRTVVIPVINRNVDSTVSKQELYETVLKAGSGDMLTEYYDENGDGSVNRADNGIFVYSCTGNVLEGNGVYGIFKATSGGTMHSFTVNGRNCAVKCGDESSVELTEGCWYSFILDGDTVNFRQGGAGLNFRISGGIAQPASPVENTLWVKTDAENPVMCFLLHSLKKRRKDWYG